MIDNEVNIYLTRSSDIWLDVHLETQDFGTVESEASVASDTPLWAHYAFTINTATGIDECYVNGELKARINPSRPSLFPLVSGGVVVRWGCFFPTFLYFAMPPLRKLGSQPPQGAHHP